MNVKYIQKERFFVFAYDVVNQYLFLKEHKKSAANICSALENI